MSVNNNKIQLIEDDSIFEEYRHRIIFQKNQQYYIRNICIMVTVIIRLSCFGLRCERPVKK